MNDSRDSQLGLRVLVTGAGGFVGGHVARHLAAGGYHVRGLIRRPPSVLPNDPPIEWIYSDLCSASDRAKAVDGQWGVVHCAGWVRLNVDRRGLSRLVNVDATRGLLHDARSAGVRRFVYTSTLQTLAAGSCEAPADEDTPWNLQSILSPYVETKREAEQLVLSASDNVMSTIALCPGMTIGPRDPGPTSTRVLLEMSRWGLAILPGGGISLVDVRLLAEAHRRALESGETGRFAIAGPYVSFREQAEIVSRICGRPHRVIAVSDRWERLICGLAGALDHLFGRRIPLLSRATVAGGFLRFYVSGQRADQLLGLSHPSVNSSIYETLIDTRDSGRATWLQKRAMTSPPLSASG